MWPQSSWDEGKETHEPSRSLLMLVHGGRLPGHTVLGGPALPWDEILSPEGEDSSKFQSHTTVNWSTVVLQAGKAGTQ